MVVYPLVGSIQRVLDKPFPFDDDTPAPLPYSDLSSSSIALSNDISTITWPVPYHDFYQHMLTTIPFDRASVFLPDPFRCSYHQHCIEFSSCTHETTHPSILYSCSHSDNGIQCSRVVHLRCSRLVGCHSRTPSFAPDPLEGSLFACANHCDGKGMLNSGIFCEVHEAASLRAEMIVMLRIM